MKKFKKFLKVIVIIVCVWFFIGLVPPLKSTEANEWLEYRDSLGRSLISAHRGGSKLNPENTEMAFDYIVENGLADIIEFDIRVTKDQQLVIIHDATINRTALDENSEDVIISETNYEDLLKYNLGKNFVNRTGETPYADISLEEADNMGLTIMLLDEFLTKYESSGIKILIEIKDKGDLATFAADETIKLIDSKYASWKKDIMIISFTDEVINYIAKEYPNQLIGALGYNILPEIAVHTFKVPVLYKANYPCIQTKMVNTAGPLKINAATKSFVEQAHKRNQTIAFWTINEVEDMDVCIEIGADIITTDAPDVLSERLGLR